MASQGWHGRRGRRGLWLAVSLLVVVGFGCGSDDGASTSAPSIETVTVVTTDPTSTEVPTTVSTTATDPSESDRPIIEVFFSTADGSDCSSVEAFPRAIAPDADPIEAAFAALASGPTAIETADGAGSFFSAATADSVLSVTQRDELLIVDFTDLRPLMPNASTSCGSEALLAQLNRTSFQFAEVERVRYQLEGSCDDFANWLQRECFDTDRSGIQLTVPTNERASGSGCTPPSADALPDGRYFGFVAEVQPGQISFDLACWFSGGAAAAAAQEDGEESPPPNDYHIRNANDLLRLLEMDASAEVSWLPNPGDPGSVEVLGFADWLVERSLRAEQPGIWIDIDEGRIVSIEEQYVP